MLAQEAVALCLSPCFPVCPCDIKLDPATLSGVPCLPCLSNQKRRGEPGRLSCRKPPLSNRAKVPSLYSSKYVPVSQVSTIPTRLMLAMCEGDTALCRGWKGTNGPRQVPVVLCLVPRFWQEPLPLKAQLPTAASASVWVVLIETCRRPLDKDLHSRLRCINMSDPISLLYSAPMLLAGITPSKPKRLKRRS